MISVIKNCKQMQPIEFELNRFLMNKVLINFTRCKICKKRNTCRQFYYQDEIISVCKKCFLNKSVKTIDLIYSGRPVEVIERNICDSNIEVTKNFYDFFSEIIMEVFMSVKTERLRK